MAHRQNTVTPAKKPVNNTSIGSVTRHAMASGHGSLNGGKSTAANIKSFMTPDRLCAYMEDSDTDADGDTGGGAKLTPQPRGVKSEKTMRVQDFDDYSIMGGGASLSAPRPKAQISSLYAAQSKHWSKSVVFTDAAARQAQSETDDEHEIQSDCDDQSSKDEAETVATSQKTTATGMYDGTQGSSPNTVMSPAYSATTPKTTGFYDSDATQHIQTVPAHFAPRLGPRKMTEAPAPVFDLTSNVSNLVGQVNARGMQSTPGSVLSGGSGCSPGLVSAQPLTTQDVFQGQPVRASPLKDSLALVQHDNNVNVGFFRGNGMSSPGSVTSTLYQLDSLSSGNGVSPGKFQLRSGHVTSWNDLVAQVREAFSRLDLPQLHDQPATFMPSNPASELLTMLTSGFTTRPAFDLATTANFEPFIPATSPVPRTMNPVVKIDELPYEVKISEIIAFVGGNAKILNDADEPVHIMMERLMAKTGAAYVEFYDLESAMKVVEKHRQSKAHGKPVRIGARIVTVTISSQDQLLTDLFPYARDVTWIGGQPHIEVSPDEFKGFVTEEELVQLVKNVEFPHRVQYAKGSPQRSVETLISIVKKFPWHMTEYITIRQRYRVYKTVVDMIEVLQGVIHNNGDNNHHGPHHYHARLPFAPAAAAAADMLNGKLLRRLVRAAMRCPGFSPLMKDNVAFVSGLDERQVTGEYGVPANAGRWRHIYTLVPNPSVPADVVEYFIALIREETTRMVDALPASSSLRRRLRDAGRETDPYFGFFWAVAGFPAGDDFERMSLRQATELELGAIDAVLARALPLPGLLLTSSGA